MRLRAVCLSSPACLLHAVGLREINFFHPHQRPLNTDTSAQRDPAPALRIAEHISRGTCVSECLSQRTKNHTKGHTDWNYIRYGRKKNPSLVNSSSASLAQNKERNENYFFLGVKIFSWFIEHNGSNGVSDEGNAFAMTTSVGPRSAAVYASWIPN